MGFLSYIFSQTGTVYDITTTETTSTGQPIEQLSDETTTIKCVLNPVMSQGKRHLYGLSDPGQVKIAQYVLYSTMQVNVGQVVEISGVKYRVTMSVPLSLHGNCHTLAYQAYVEHYQHN